jgi:hypothetical protein
MREGILGPGGGRASMVLALGAAACAVRDGADIDGEISG